MAIPLLESAGVSFHNPQVDEWCEELVEIENRAKRNADVLLFVIDDQTRALMSIVEAVELIVSGRKVALCVRPLADGQSIAGDTLGKAELKDLNRVRHYLKDIAERFNVPIRSSVAEAVYDVISLVAKPSSATQEPLPPLRGVLPLKRSRTLPAHGAPSGNCCGSRRRRGSTCTMNSTKRAVTP